MNEEQIARQEVCKQLVDLYQSSESRIKADAIVSRAYIDKVSLASINDKVSSQMNSIKSEITRLNPKFNENSKNYTETKEMVLETLANYEKALIDLSKFYDTKLEQLILKKVELESALVCSMLNKEYLEIRLDDKIVDKEKDGLKNLISENIKNILSRFSKDKESKVEIDVKDIRNLQDQQDVSIEVENKLEDRISNTKIRQDENIQAIEAIEKELSEVNQKIDSLSSKKINSIYDAMEIGDKQISTNVKRVKVFGKITRFFVAKFNTPKAVRTQIIEPLNLRIESFINSDSYSVEE